MVNSCNYRKIHPNLKDSGQQCGIKRVWRLMKKIDGTREEAQSNIFAYIEIFYNSKCRHGSSDLMLPTEYENQYYQRIRSVWIIRGDLCWAESSRTNHLHSLYHRSRIILKGDGVPPFPTALLGLMTPGIPS